MTTSKRTVKTPGAAKQPEVTTTEVAETTQPTTAQQADAALESITGKGLEPQDQSTNETSSVSEPVEPTAEELEAKKEYEEFLQWRKNKGEAAKPVKATVQPIQSQAEVKRIQNVLTEHGWDSVEE